MDERKAIGRIIGARHSNDELDDGEHEIRTPKDEDGASVLQGTASEARLLEQSSFMSNDQPGILTAVKLDGQNSKSEIFNTTGRGVEPHTLPNLDNVCLEDNHSTRAEEEAQFTIDSTTPSYTQEDYDNHPSQNTYNSHWYAPSCSQDEHNTMSGYMNPLPMIQYAQPTNYSNGGFDYVYKGVQHLGQGGHLAWNGSGWSHTNVWDQNYNQTHQTHPLPSCSAPQPVNQYWLMSPPVSAVFHYQPALYHIPGPPGYYAYGS